MLYLGQACKYKRYFDGETRPGIFLGFKQSKTSLENDALILALDEGKLFCDSFGLDRIGFIKEADESSPTGYRIFRGDYCKNIVDENAVLKWPSDEVAFKVLTEAANLMKVDI